MRFNLIGDAGLPAGHFVLFIIDRFLGDDDLLVFYDIENFLYFLQAVVV